MGSQGKIRSMILDRCCNCSHIKKPGVPACPAAVGPRGLAGWTGSLHAWHCIWQFRSRQMGYPVPFAACLSEDSESHPARHLYPSALQGVGRSRRSKNSLSRGKPRYTNTTRIMTLSTIDKVHKLPNETIRGRLGASVVAHRKSVIYGRSCRDCDPIIRRVAQIYEGTFNSI